MGMLAERSAADAQLDALAGELSNVPGEGGGDPDAVDGVTPKGEHPRHGRRTGGHDDSPNRRRHRHEDEGPPDPGRAPAGHPFRGLPGPGSPPVSSVPPAALESFRLPLFLIPVYQAAGLRYGVPWEVLAAINEIESDYGRNPTESSAGAVGWMQFMPATWSQWGEDANADGMRDPADPVDAIYSAARYLQASGAGSDLRRAVFAYNHADWYVDSVLLRARLIGAYPADVVGTLSSLATARFPVAAPSRFAAGSTSATVYSERGAPVVAPADGVVR